MTDETTWLTLPEVAERLGIVVTRVRDLLDDRHLLAARRGPNDALHVPETFLIERPDGAVSTIPTFRGTATLLADAGLSDDEALRWMMAFHDELGEAPIDALRAGKRSHVRRVAQTVF